MGASCMGDKRNSGLTWEYILSLIAKSYKQVQGSEKKAWIQDVPLHKQFLHFACPRPQFLLLLINDLVGE